MRTTAEMKLFDGLIRIFSGSGFRFRSKKKDLEPYYQNDSITIYHGDCLTILPQLGIKFDACITDPPYGITFCGWDSVIPFDKMWKQIYRSTKKTAVICLFGSEPYSSKLRCSNMKDFKYDWIWEKSKASNFLKAKTTPLKTHEIISVFYHASPITYNPQMQQSYPYPPFKSKKQGSNAEHLRGEIPNPRYRRGSPEGLRYPRSVIYFKTSDNEKDTKLHPTQKPIALMEFLIRTYTNEGEIILDFAAGSGTTGIAAMNLNRKCVLIEKEEKYYNFSLKRILSENSKKRLF